MLLFSLGVLLAIAWARLGAPDIAMVEAALGAGVTGVLFLSALASVGPDDAAPRAASVRVALAALAAAAVAPVALAVEALPRAFEGLGREVLARVPETGATHPVTSVLLDFRGYDTLLEIAVLLLAVLGAWAARGGAPAPRPPAPGAILSAAVRLLLPLMVVVAGVLLWVGSSAPGGAFQAGTVLGTTLVLATLSGGVAVPRVPPWVVRSMLALGFAVFLAVAGATAASERALLRYPGAHAAGLLLAIETALTISIAVVVWALFERDPEERGAEGEASGREGRAA
jgi:multisubunit Na+/H+ antiporter MnhB subunit